jgi:hypothetical protein
MGGFAVKVIELIQAVDPMTIAADVAMVASIVRRLEQTVMRTVSFCDYFLHQ